MNAFHLKTLPSEAKHNIPPVAGWLVGYSALLFLLSWILPYVFGLVGRDMLSLHTTVFFGIDLIGPGEKVWVIPGVAAILAVTHGLLAYLFRRVPYLFIVILASLAVLLSILIAGLFLLRLINI